jgi:hypothetical protein
MVGSLDGNLQCTLTEGLATDVTSDSNATGGEAIKFENNSTLADASYNHTTDHLFTDIEGSSCYEDLGTWVSAGGNAVKWDYGEVGTSNAVHYYYAATWTMKFSYTFAAERTALNLFFNVASASAQIVDNAGSTDTAQGFRLAFVTGTAGSPANGVVWAPFATQATWDDDGNAGTDEVDKIRYVSTAGTPAANQTPEAPGTIGTYTHDTTNKIGDLLDSTDTGVARYNQAANTTPPTTATNYIGTFAKPDTPNTKVDLTVRCTAWFEGTDPLITTRENATVMQSVKVTIPFYVRNAAA